MTKYNLSRKFFYTVLTLVLIIFIESITFFFLQKNALTSNRFVQGVSAVNQQDMAKWSQYIDSLGAQKAYEKFKNDYKSSNFGIQHNAAHLIGELLFEKKGIDGLTICDSTFSFGCYHGFFAAAVERNGLKILPDLDKACTKKYGLKGLGCPHGIGHGILSYLGDSHLFEALENCSKLSWKEPIGGCTSGVFMEYNFHTMQNPNGLTLRSLKMEDPYAPCSTLPEKYLQACYYEQASWWEKIYNYNYTKVGKLCDSIQNNLSREACFRGLGQIVGPSSKFIPNEAKKRCSLMPNKEEELLCRQGVAWSFFAEPSQKERAPQLCDDLDQTRKYVCIGGTDMYKNVKNTL